MVEIYRCVCDKPSLLPLQVFQRRMGGPGVDFYRGWNDYKNGFGSLLTEFWLGNEKLALLTNQRDYQLRIDIVNKRHSSYFAKYTSFRIGDERLHYKLVDIGVFEGTTGRVKDYINKLDK